MKRNQAFLNSLGEGRRQATVALPMESEKCRFCDFKPQEIQRSKGEEKKARQQSAVSAKDTHK